MTDDTNDELLEELAELEHEQWMHWSMAVAENNDIPDELHDKWMQNWKPYEYLDEETKEHDRKWARKVIEIISDENDSQRQSGRD